MRIMICEDQPNHQKALLSALNEWAGVHHCPDCSVEAFETAEQVLFHSDLFAETDGFFLDLYLPGRNGFELAQEIRNKNPQVPIIFISSSGEYLQQGYEVAAYRYLVKPFTKKDIETCMNYCRAYFEGRTQRSFTVRRHGELLYLSYSEVILLSGSGHTVTIQTGTESYTVRSSESFSEFVDTFPEAFFVRCHQSFLVSLSAIRRFSANELVLSNGQSVPISRRYKQATLDKVGRFFMGGTPR